MDKILKFSASWCGPCKALTASLQNVDLGVPVEEVDIDENSAIAVEYGIRSVPTLVYLKEGSTVAGRMIGSKPVKEITEWASRCK